MRISPKVIVLIALVLASMSAQAQRGPWHFFGFLTASGTSLSGNVVSAAASGEIWCDYPAQTPVWLHAGFKVDGVEVWNNGDPGIPRSWPGLVFDYNNFQYTLSSGTHFVEWYGGPNPILFNTTNPLAFSWYFSATYVVP